VQVTGVFVAADGGRVGDLIRIVNPDTRRALKARVTKQGTVEVINERQ
jgi:flagella basal body P-ring formation protein FlgA